MRARVPFTTDEMRELSKGRGSQFLVDDMKAALAYAADVIDAARLALEAEHKRSAGVPVTPKGLTE